MNALLKKEMRLSALLLSYLFIGFSIMTLLPGYPILCGVFFITLGIYHSFQNARESNDIVFSALLPIAKRDVVKGKYQFCVLIELCGFFMMATLTLVRMTFFSGSTIYHQNALMNANPFFLGTALLLFGMFNLIFVGGFFRKAYSLGKPFVTYIVTCFLIIGIAEALHHFPGLEPLNAFGTDHIVLQLSALFSGLLLYILLTFVSYNKACKSFDNIDL
jgi:hypothetical protein